MIAYSDPEVSVLPLLETALALVLILSSSSPGVSARLLKKRS